MKNTLLIIDADNELADLLALYLESEGFKVECSYDGEMGEKRAVNHEFDAIILDITLPKRNGFEVLKTIKAHVERLF